MICKANEVPEDANDLLIRAGFLRQVGKLTGFVNENTNGHGQAYSGVFHLLPLGLRVQDKLERLIDKHMRSLGTLPGYSI